MKFKRTTKQENYEELLYIEDELGGYVCTKEYILNHVYLTDKICCCGTKEELERYLNITITDSMIRIH